MLVLSCRGGAVGGSDEGSGEEGKSEDEGDESGDEELLQLLLQEKAAREEKAGGGAGGPKQKRWVHARLLEVKLKNSSTCGMVCLLYSACELQVLTVTVAA